MKHSIFRASVALVALLGGQAVWAQGAPGSDPIILTDQVSYLALPAPAFQPSGQLEQSGEMPAWLQAKVTRFEAKAFADVGGGSGVVFTERDVISTQRGNALQRTCSTNVASNVGQAAAAGPANRYGPGSGQDQMVVLRGDLVTICK